MSTAPHLEATLQRDIERIRNKVVEMSAQAERSLETCLKALVGGNRQFAYAVILRDRYIDEMEKEIDRLCLEFLVRQQPVAGLLRFAYATIKINAELEGVGDLAETIARQTLKLDTDDLPVPIERFVEMANLTIPMVRDATKAFVSQDAELAKKTIETENVVDILKSRLNADLVHLFRENKIPFEVLSPLMMICRHLERVSDEARNICMEVLYMCTGEYAKHPGSEVLRMIFVDEHNSCRSIMAEAVANSMNLPGFIFSSAGLDPQPIGSATISFMKDKGLDVSRLVPKAINQIPNLDHYHVIVALAPEIKRAFPQRPRKTVYLDWSVKDPSKTQGSPAEIRAAYEQTYRFIHDNIHDLVQAILGDQNQQLTLGYK
ncbi:MAG: phosphate signaling complex protein PhoU [Verrucomicrobia bacterium]|nr:phosphate signaling complex protein PhoU [Verrucomicrobiota bacterium]